MLDDKKTDDKLIIMVTIKLIDSLISLKKAKSYKKIKKIFLTPFLFRIL